MKQFISLFAALALGLSCLNAGAQQMQQLPNDPAVRKGQLENGLTYYIRHNDKPAGRAEFYLATNVGAIQEAPDQDGLAHFLEHMCFNGTKNFPGKAILDYLQSIGASFGGNVNASTGVEQTTYMLNNIPLLRETVIDTCILIMHDYAHFVTNAPEEIDKERPVIIEERRARRNASWRMHEKSLPYYYGDTKYGSCTLIGLQENLENFKHESLVNFYQTWYHPDMQALIVVGDVDVDAVEKKIAKIFSDIPKAVNPKPKEVIRIPGNAEPVIGIITDPEATSTNFEVLWKTDAAPEELNSTVAGKVNMLVKAIIGSVMGERFQDITAKSDAPFLNASLGIGNMCETMDVTIGGVACKEGEAIPGLKAFMTEAEKMKRFGFTDAEVERAKADILSAYETRAKKADTRKNAELVSPLISNFFDNTTYMVPQQEYELMQQLLPMLNSQVLNQVAASVITDSNLVVLYKAPEKEGLVHPTEAQIRAVIDEVRAADIQANAEEAMSTDLLDPALLKGCKIKKTAQGLYDSQVLTLKNGLKVILLPTDYEKDKIQFELYKNGGMSLIPAEDLPSFESNVWGLFQSNSGVSKFPATTVTKMLAGKYASASPYITGLRHGISGSSTAKDLETAFQLMYLYFTDPRFDQNEYDQGIKMINNVLPNMVKQPNYKMQKQMMTTLYGENPRQVLISEESVAKANLATIEKNYRKLFHDVGGATAIIVGDFNIETIKPLVTKYFGSLPKGKKGTPWVDPNTDILPGNRVNDFAVDMQTPQTTVLQVYTAPVSYSVAKQTALSAASYILDMRYVTSLREEEGGTYGASSSASLGREPKEEALIQVSFNSKPSKADKLRELAIDGLKKLAEEGPTPEEFTMAVENLTKKLPESRITNRYWHGILKTYDLYKYDRNVEYEASIKALTPEAIQNALKEVLASGNFVEVIMRPANAAEVE